MFDSRLNRILNALSRAPHAQTLTLAQKIDELLAAHPDFWSDVEEHLILVQALTEVLSPLINNHISVEWMIKDLLENEAGLPMRGETTVVPTSFDYRKLYGRTLIDADEREWTVMVASPLRPEMYAVLSNPEDNRERIIIRWETIASRLDYRAELAQARS